MTKNNRPAIAVFAYSEVGYVCLETLLQKGANVSVVFTHRDAPGEEIWFRSVAELAASRDVPVRADARLGDDVAALLRSLHIELIFSSYYRAMIPATILKIPRLGAYNVHGALLPKYRGRACINWAILNGETETGTTLHVMTELADRGDIIDQERVPILHSDTAHDVFLKVAEASRLVVGRSLAALESGIARRTLQDETQATKYGRRTPEDGRIDWNKSAGELYNLVRALTHPFPGAFTELDGKKLFIWRARAIEGAAQPGAIVSTKPFLSGTGGGLLEVLAWQFEGESERSL